MRRQAISSLCERHSVLTQTQTVQYSLLHTYAIRYSLLLLCYKPVQHVTVLNTVGNCNTAVSIVILYYNIMGPPSYMRSVVVRTSYSVLTQTQTVQYSLLHTYAIRYSLLLLCYKPVQHVTVLNAVGNCNTAVSIVMLYCDIVGPPLCMRSVVDRNFVMWRVTVIC